MLNGPALLRVFLVVIAAAVLTGLVQHYWIFDNNPPEPSKPVLRPTAQNTPVRKPEPPTARVAATPVPAPQPATLPPQAQAAAPVPQPQEAPKPAPQAQNSAPSPFAQSDNQSAAPAPGPVPNPAPVAPEPAAVRPPPGPRPSTPPTAAPVAAQPEPSQDEAVEQTDGRAVDLVDLNTGSLAELNRLKGGGTIGRAIVQHRPYTSADQLLSKRVLSRATYQRIKDQVTVR